MRRKQWHTILLGMAGVAGWTGLVYAGEAGGGHDLTGKMNLLVFQLGVIIFAAWGGGDLFRRMRLPGVLGEILAGTLIGPYALGRIPLWGFAEGLFPLAGDFPVSVELYSFSAIAAIVLLFIVGLETNIDTFLKYSVAGSVVGLSGVIFSFIAGDVLGVLFSRFVLHADFGPTHPVPLFLGVISTATSVGISARIISERNKSNSPEGVTILSAAVIDDVLGIITLAIVIGMARSGHIGWKEIVLIAFRTFSIWLGFTVLGLMCAQKLSALLGRVKNPAMIAVLSFALALFLSGIFERAGLAMIIGAYVMGLSLSKTDLASVIRHKLSGLEHFFVPVFFCIMGMLIDIREASSGPILSFGLIYVVFAVIGKLVGCSLPALFLNFNLRGALRVGVGMVPRGEVALIVAGIGLSSGIIDHQVFSIAVIMTFITTLITPPFLSMMLNNDLPVLRRPEKGGKSNHRVRYDMPNPETAELVLEKVIRFFEEEGFFVIRLGLPEVQYHIRKDNIFIVLRGSPEQLEFECREEDASFVHTVFYEVMAELERVMARLQSLSNRHDVGKMIFKTGSGNGRTKRRLLHQSLAPDAVTCTLKAADKHAALEEMVDLLISAGQMEGALKDEVVGELWAREQVMSTGMQDGVCLPHAKTSRVTRIMCALGLSPGGIDWGSFDQKSARIIMLTLIPKDKPETYLRLMAEFNRYLSDSANRKKILTAGTRARLYEEVAAGGR